MIPYNHSEDPRSPREVRIKILTAYINEKYPEIKNTLYPIITEIIKDFCTSIWAFSYPVLMSFDNNRSVVYWYGYDNDNQPIWNPPYGDPFEIPLSEFNNYINFIKTDWKIQEINQDMSSITPLRGFIPGLMTSKTSGWKDVEGNDLYIYGPGQPYENSFQKSVDLVSKIYGQVLNDNTRPELLNESDKFEIFLYEYDMKRNIYAASMSFYNEHINDKSYSFGNNYPETVLNESKESNVFLNYTPWGINNFFMNFRVFSYLTHGGFLKFKNSGFKMVESIFFPSLISVYNISFDTFTLTTQNLRNIMNNYSNYIWVFGIKLPAKYFDVCSYETGLTLIVNAITHAYINADITQARAIHDSYASVDMTNEILKNAASLVNYIPGIGALLAAGITAAAMSTDETQKINDIITQAQTDITLITTDMGELIPLTQIAATEYESQSHINQNTGLPVDPPSKSKTTGILTAAGGILALILFNS